MPPTAYLSLRSPAGLFGTRFFLFGWVLALCLAHVSAFPQGTKANSLELKTDTVAPAFDPGRLPVESFSRPPGFGNATSAGFSSEFSDSLAKVRAYLLKAEQVLKPRAGYFDLVGFAGLDSVNRWSSGFVLASRVPLSEPPPSNPSLLSRRAAAEPIASLEDEGNSILIKGRSKESTDWIFLIIFLSLSVLTLTRYTFPRLFYRVIRAAFSQQEALKLYRENPILYVGFSRLLSVVFYLNCGLFLFLVFRFSGYQLYRFSDFVTFLLITGALFVFISAKVIVYRILAWLFSVQNLTKEYLFNAFSIRRVGGIALFPVIIGIPFMAEDLTGPFIFLGFIFLIISYLLQLGRGFLLISRRQVLIYYIILYFCTLEILPPLALFRLIQLAK